MAFAKIVINRDLMAGIEQLFRADGTNIAGAAGDKNVHAGTMKENRAGSKFKMAGANLSRSSYYKRKEEYSH
jgi:hypothetical protein